MAASCRAKKTSKGRTNTGRCVCCGHRPFFRVSVHVCDQEMTANIYGSLFKGFLPAWQEGLCQQNLARTAGKASFCEPAKIGFRECHPNAPASPARRSSSQTAARTSHHNTRPTSFTSSEPLGHLNDEWRKVATIAVDEAIAIGTTTTTTATVNPDPTP